MYHERGVHVSQVFAEGAALLERQFGIRHTTMQVLAEGNDCSELSCRGDNCHFEIQPQQNEWITT
jgi:hypothetical protein